jgi:undecaprenyl-diphosphatase
MRLIEAVILGFVQGITEFLPISSTAHIIIVQRLLGFEFGGLNLEIFLHLASVLAVILFFYKDLLEIIVGFFWYILKREPKDKVLYWFGVYILSATFITGIIGLVVKDYLVDFMKKSWFMAITLTITGVFLIIIERFREYGKRTQKEMRFMDALIVGLSQSIAVLPGLSRSGTTLIAGLWAGLSRETAVRYSFILAIPVILGASLMGDFNNEILSEVGVTGLVVSFISTFLFSLLGIHWLIGFLKKGRLFYFSIYCFLMAFLLITVIR